MKFSYGVLRNFQRRVEHFFRGVRVEILLQGFEMFSGGAEIFLQRVGI